MKGERIALEKRMYAWNKSQKFGKMQTYRVQETRMESGGD